MTLLQTDLLPNKTETFAGLRYLFQQSDPQLKQSYVVGQSDYLVAQRGAGANMSVDVGAGDAWVIGGSTARQGTYHQTNDATVNVVVTTANATNPRLDQVLLVIGDSSVFGAVDTPSLVVVAGTPTAGATLANRNGAVVDATLNATYGTWMRLADVLVPAAAASIVTANIYDRRPKMYGKSIIATTESRTNTVYGSMPTPDMVTNLVLPADGLIYVAYQATWQESVAAAGRAAIFIGANQLVRAPISNGGPAVQDASINRGGTGYGPNVDFSLTSYSGGLQSVENSGSAGGITAYTGDVSTGQVQGLTGSGGTATPGGGGVPIFAAAGTYDISIQFKSTSGSVTAKNRKLWAWVIPFP